MRDYLICLLHFTLKSTTHALALKPKPLVVSSRDRGRDTGCLNSGIVRRDYGIVCRDCPPQSQRVKSLHSCYRALFLLYHLFQTKKIFYSPDDAVATATVRFGEETRAGGGVVFNVKWRRYQMIQQLYISELPCIIRPRMMGLFNSQP